VQVEKWVVSRVLEPLGLKSAPFTSAGVENRHNITGATSDIGLRGVRLFQHDLQFNST